MLQILQLLAFLPLVVAARLRREERRLIDRFQAAAANLPERAITVQNRGTLARFTLQRLLRAGAVVAAAADRYYVSDAGYRRFRARRRKRALIVIPLVIVIALIVFFSSGDPAL